MPCCATCVFFTKEFGQNKCLRDLWGPNEIDQRVRKWLKIYMPKDDTRILPDAQGCPGYRNV